LLGSSERPQPWAPLIEFYFFDCIFLATCRIPKTSKRLLDFFCPRHP
jgi:hypothetical protein